MKLDVVRLERQTIGVDKWQENKYIGTYNYCTGVGKTFTAILSIKRILKQFPDLSVTILLPKEPLVKQWWDNLKEHFPNNDLNWIDIYTAQEIISSSIKIKTGLLIVDELHLFLGEEFFKTIDGETYIKYDYNLGLTGTYIDPDNRHIKYQLTFPIVDEIDEKEAIDKGFVAKYLEFNLAVSFTLQEKAYYEAYSTVIRNNISKFGRKPLDLATKCLAGGKFQGQQQKAFFFCSMWAASKGWREGMNLNIPENKKIDDIWNPKKIMGYASNLMTAIRKRKDLLYNCQSKALVTVEILKKFLNDKAIVFGEKTNYADKVALFMNKEYPNYCVVYHSNIPTQIIVNPKTGKKEKFGKVRLKRKAIDAIRTGKSKAICAASSLDTGFDVPDIVLGIIGSGTQNFNKQKQRGGRVKRVSDLLSDDKTKMIINLYIKDTKDEEWLKRRQSKSDNVTYWINSIDEIVLNPVDKKEFNMGVL